MALRRPALSREFIEPSKPNEKLNRPFMGMALIILADMLGAFFLLERELPREWVPRILALVIGLCAAGGALYHPVRRFWLKGLVAGLAVGLLSLVTTYFYMGWRFSLTGSVWSAEMLLPLALGSLPGVGLYYLMMRDETVDDPV